MVWNVDTVARLSTSKLNGIRENATREKKMQRRTGVTKPSLRLLQQDKQSRTLALNTSHASCIDSDANAHMVQEKSILSRNALRSNDMIKTGGRNKIKGKTQGESMEMSMKMSGWQTSVKLNCATCTRSWTQFDFRVQSVRQLSQCRVHERELCHKEEELRGSRWRAS